MCISLTSLCVHLLMLLDMTLSNPQEASESSFNLSSGAKGAMHVCWFSPHLCLHSPVISSSSTRDYVVTLPEGTSETRTYQWRQTISFQSCQHDESLRSMKPTQMLNVDQIFVMYDSTNMLMRYAMSNKIADVNGEVTRVIVVPS